MDNQNNNMENQNTNVTEPVQPAGPTFTEPVQPAGPTFTEPVQQPVYTQPQTNAQPAYSAPVNNGSDDQPNNLAVTGLVLGIASLVLPFIPEIPYFGFLSGVAGIIVSAIAKKRPGKRKMANAGLICSIIGVSLTVLMVACVLCAAAAIVGSIASMG